MAIGALGGPEGEGWRASVCAPRTSSSVGQRMCSGDPTATETRGRATPLFFLPPPQAENDRAATWRLPCRERHPPDAGRARGSFDGHIADTVPTISTSTASLGGSQDSHSRSRSHSRPPPDIANPRPPPVNNTMAHRKKHNAPQKTTKHIIIRAI